MAQKAAQMRAKAGSRSFMMMMLNISCRDVAQSEGLSCSALVRTKRSFDGAVELRPVVLNVNSLRTGKLTVRSVCFPVDLRCNPSALRMIPCSSLEQGIRVIEQGIHLSKHGILQFCFGAFGNRIPLALFLPKRRNRRRSV